MIEFHASLCVEKYVKVQFTHRWVNFLNICISIDDLLLFYPASCSREMENSSEWTNDAVTGPPHISESGEDATSEQQEVAGPSNRRVGGEDAVAGPSNRRGDEDAVARTSLEREG